MYLLVLQDSARKLYLQPGDLIIVVPITEVVPVAVLAVAVVIRPIVGRAVINASIVIPIPGIAVASIIVAKSVIARAHRHSEAEVLSPRLGRNQSKQP
jgi:hypothetical protein